MSSSKPQENERVGGKPARNPLADENCKLKANWCR